MNDFQKLSKLPPYVFTMTDKLKAEALAAGHDVLDFAMGNPDQPAPKAVVDVAIASLQDPHAHRYTSSQGTEMLREAICRWYQRRFQVTLDVETETVATLGSKEGISHLTMAMINPGDKALSPSPCYPIHRYGFVLAGGDMSTIELEPMNTFLSRLEDTVTKEKPKAMILNFPANPSTHTVDLAFLTQVVDIALKYQVWLIHDLAYADICFDDYQVPSILQVPRAKEIAVETYSLSKSYNMPGWRVGFVCGNPALVGALKKIKTYYDYGMFYPIQAAAAYALDHDKELTKPICQMYQSRRDVLCRGLQKLGWSFDIPKATMFVWAKIPAAHRSSGSLAFAEMLLKTHYVSISPGMAFGDNCDDHVRLSLIEPEDRIEMAIERLSHL